MSIWRLVVRELVYRPLSFGLAVLAVVVAVGCLVAQLTLLRAHEVRAERLGDDKLARTQEMLAALEDDYRKIAKGLGYNILILPLEQDLGAFYADGYATATMPETYVYRLADSKIMTVRHLLPTLQKRIVWPERDFPVILMGTRGEVPLAHRSPREPMQTSVEPGGMVVGHVVGRRLGLDVGDREPLLGRTFVVTEVLPARGNEDDVTVWIDLSSAQQLLGRPGEINAILALSCFCAQSNLQGIREEIGRILPDTQILELTREAAIRRAARGRASAHTQQAMAAEEAGRVSLRAARRAFAEWLVPLVALGCTVWVGLLALTNVRERRREVGILRALGLRARQIFGVFIARALIVGLSGAALGYAVGAAVGAAWGAGGEGGAALLDAAVLLNPWLLVGALGLAPLWSAVASLLPAAMAAAQDPAVVLREE